MGLQSWALLFLLFGAFLLLSAQLWVRYRSRKAAPLATRPVAAFRDLRRELACAAEAGRAIHVALGSGALTGEEAGVSLAALQVVDGLVEDAVALRVPLIITVGDATLLPIAQDVLRRAYVRLGLAELYDPDWVRFVAPDALAYAAGAAPVAAEPGVALNVSAGAFGPEVTLITDTGLRRGIAQAAAVATPSAAGALYPALEWLAIGEELFASGATLRAEQRSRVAALWVQDILRGTVALALLASAVFTLINR